MATDRTNPDPSNPAGRDQGKSSGDAASMKERLLAQRRAEADAAARTGGSPAGSAPPVPAARPAAPGTGAARAQAAAAAARAASTPANTTPTPPRTEARTPVPQERAQSGLMSPARTR